MNKIEILIKCMQLNLTVFEAFDYVQSNISNASAVDEILKDLPVAIETIMQNAALVLDEQGNSTIHKSGERLLEIISRKDKSDSFINDFIQSANEWETNSSSSLYAKGIEISNICKEKDNTQAIQLLELILTNKPANHFHALASYILSRKLSSIEPLRACQLSIEAFTTKRNLAKYLTPSNSPIHNYIYQEVEDAYFEHCPICQGDGLPYYAAMPLFMADYSHKYNPFKLWMKCASCEQIYAYNFPKQILQPQTEETVLSQNHMKPRVPLAIFGDILNNIKSYTQGKRLLEIGAGGGEMIAAALELGYDVKALEVVAPQAQWLGELLDIEVLGIDFLEYTDNSKYDVIIMGDVIEHVSQPVAMLKKAYDLLEDDGVMWISTPNFQSGFSRIKKFADPMWNEPSHITYFSYAGFEKILHENGLKVVNYKISNRYNGSMEIIAVKNQGPIS